MKIFLDTGDIEAIKKAYKTGLIDGVTTNPTMIAKTGKKFMDVVKEICDIVPGPVSAEPVGETTEDLIVKAEEIASIAKDVDAIILTHSHLDHSGAVPIFHITNDTPVYGTQPTFDLTELLITDFIHLSGYYLPYEFIDLQSMNACCRDIGYRNPTRVKSMVFLCQLVEYQLFCQVPNFQFLSPT